MLTLTFTVADLARTRLAMSPLWEVVASIRLLKSPRPHPFHHRWARATRERLAGTELDLLFDLVDPAVWYLADFLTPPPNSPLPDLESDLGTLRRVPPEQVRADLDVLAYARRRPFGSLAEAQLPRRLRRPKPGELPSRRVAELYADPGEGIARLADQVTTYWELGIAPYWGRIRALLDGDLLYRGRRLGQAGPAGLFEDLADGVRWRDGTLSIRHRRFHGERNLTGEGLLLTPSAFVWPTVYSSTIPPWQPTLTYPARGIATLWDDSARPTPSGLAAVLGHSRADLLVHLDAPRSTTELATRAGLTPGGVSQHLTALRAAGLVTRHRSGRTVLYARTTAADTLLDAGS
jgi:DNA-binding transcriptional ArsR family regulator